MTLSYWAWLISSGVGYNEELPATGIDPALPSFVNQDGDILYGSGTNINLYGSGTFTINITLSCGGNCQRKWPDADCSDIFGCEARPQRVVVNRIETYIDDVLFFNDTTPEWTNNTISMNYGNDTHPLPDGSHDILVLVWQDIDWYDDMQGEPHGSWQIIEDYASGNGLTINVDSEYYERQERIKYDIVFWITIIVIGIFGFLGFVYFIKGAEESYYRIQCERIAGSKELREFFKCDERLLDVDKER